MEQLRGQELVAALLKKTAQITGIREVFTSHLAACLFEFSGEKCHPTTFYRMAKHNSIPKKSRAKILAEFLEIDISEIKKEQRQMVNVSNFTMPEHTFNPSFPFADEHFRGSR